MSDKSKIPYCESSWSPWRGCEPKSPGCKNCWAKAQVNRFGGDFSKRVRAAAATFNAPLQWNKKPWACECGSVWCDEWRNMTEFCGCGKELHRRRVFLGSLMDWLDPEVPVEWLADALQVIRECPGLDFLCLTKRPEQFNVRLQAVRRREQYTKLSLWADEWLRGTPPANVWIGTSVEDDNQKKRINDLLDIAAHIHFLSVEPLIAPQVNLTPWLRAPKNHRMASKPNLPGVPTLDWVIVGGESGPNRRDCGVDAIVDVANQCKRAGVPCFVKQDCSARPGAQGRIPDAIWNLKQFPK